MDSLANYGSDGDNSNNSDDAKMPCSTGAEVPERRASDANYDPVQMDMSEESNNNNSSGDSESERASSPPTERQPSGSRTDSKTDSRTDSSRHRSSPADQRRSDHDSHSSNSRDDHKRSSERSERSRRSRESSKSRRSSHDERRHRDADHSSSRDSRESKKSRDDERKSSRDEDRRKDRTSSSSCRDDRSDDRSDKSERDHHHRDDRRDRDRDRSDRDYRRDRDRRHSRDDRTKDRHREERSSRERKDAKARTRSRSRSKDRAPPPPFRAMSYREEKGRNKLAQLEKLGIELKAPGGEPVVPIIPGEPNYYNPLATATQGKYAEQIQKRKLLWANKSKQDEGKAAVSAASTANTWMGTTFTHDQDGKVTAKFKRLMGIKGDLPVTPQPGHKPDILKKQEEMFNNMEQQYEVARATTHTQRGVGLGYASGGYQFPR